MTERRGGGPTKERKFLFALVYFPWMQGISAIEVITLRLTGKQP